MGRMKDFSNKFFKSAGKISKKSDKLIKMGECKLDIKHLEKDIARKKALIGHYIHQWYMNRAIDINEVPRLCKEICEREKEINKIQNEINRLMKEIDDE